MANRVRIHASCSHAKNRILSALTVDEYRSISRHLSFVNLKQGDVLYNTDNWIDFAYFVISGMASSLSVTAEGLTVEDGIVGLEGLLGGMAALGDGRIFCSGIVQIPGNAMRIGARELRYEFKHNTGFSGLLMDYLNDLRLQMDQSSRCQGLHSLEQRLCRLLLISLDCSPSAILPLSLRFLSRAVGATRAEVFLAACALNDEGLISYRHNWIRITKREEMEHRACGCYLLYAHRLHHPPS